MAAVTKSKRTEEEEARARSVMALRQTWLRYGVNRKICLLINRRPKARPDNKLQYEYYCHGCLGWFLKDLIKVDHILACGGLPSWAYGGEYILRLFTGECQTMCKKCHDLKTKEERRRK